MDRLNCRQMTRPSLSKLTSRSLAKSLALFACCLAFPACADKPRPDVILVVVDTLRADRMSCYGYDRPTTPFMDRLANEGALFEDVTAQFSWTVPSMVSMFTGRYLTDLTEEVGSNQTTLAQSFESAGYVTIGASANLLLQADTGLLAGFDAFSAASEDDLEQNRSLTELGESVLRDASSKVDLDRPSGEREPIFFYLHAFEPHDPYQRYPGVDKAFLDMNAKSLAPDGWHEDQLLSHRELAPEEDSLWAAELEWIDRARDRYDQEIRSVDEQLESFVESLRARGILDNAIIAIVSDHGEGLWDHKPAVWLQERATESAQARERLPREFFYQKHGAIQFQDVLATPMLIWGAGVRSGVRIETPVENIDLVPTLLEFANVPSTAGLHGRSLVRAIKRARGEPRDYIYSLGVQGATVRELASGLKLIVAQRKSAKLGETNQLYHLPSDPLERKDLIGHRPKDAARLLSVFEEWLVAYPTERASGSGSRASERTSALRKRLSAIGYAAEETTDKE